MALPEAPPLANGLIAKVPPLPKDWFDCAPQVINCAAGLMTMSCETGSAAA